MTSKYVAGVTNSGVKAAIIIPETLNHSDTQHLFSSISSAGTVQVGTNCDGELVYAIYGKSTSLGVESNQDDLWLVKAALGINDY